MAASRSSFARIAQKDLSVVVSRGGVRDVAAIGTEGRSFFQSTQRGVRRRFCSGGGATARRANRKCRPLGTCAATPGGRVGDRARRRCLHRRRIEHGNDRTARGGYQRSVDCSLNLGCSNCSYDGQGALRSAVIPVNL